MSVRFEDRSDIVLAQIVQRLEAAVQQTVDDIQADAKNTVRVDINPATVDDIVLRDSIATEVEGLTGIVYIEGDAQNYSLVQEFGHPLYPQYGFTPYMRPACIRAGAKFYDRVRRALQ